MEREEAIEKLLEVKGHRWAGVIEVHAGEFSALKSVCEAALGAIVRAKSVRDLRNINYYGSNGVHEYWFNGSFHCPAEARVMELRKEADELEKQINAGKS